MHRSLAALALLIAPVLADDAPKVDGQGDKPTTTPDPIVTRHRTTIDGALVEYTATVGKLAQQTDEGEIKAEIFFVAYTRDGDLPVGQRPITFCFNGGPGSSSVWLHLGMLGPQRVRIPDDATMPTPPYRTLPNPHSLLDVTDLVMIDPVSTGYSRPAKGEDRKQFHGYEEDLRSVGQFIHDFTTKYGRWSSPKFVLGESYGGLRAAGLAGTLQDRYSMYLNGLVLVSAVVDFSTLRFADNNDLPFVLFLPSYTATAWYHGALAEELQVLPLSKLVERAESFAMGPYATLLVQGDRMPAADRDVVVRELALLTGLGEQYVIDSRYRIEMGRFAKELLRSRGQVTGRLDSRFLGIDRDNVGERYSYDPSDTSISGAFAAGMNEYLRTELGYTDNRVYEVLSSQVQPWSYDTFENRYVSAAETLRHQMSANPHLKVFAACGHYDLATPQLAMQHTRDHLSLAPELRKNFRMEFYEGGHMMYIHEPSLVRLRQDLLQFYAESVPQE